MGIFCKGFMKVHINRVTLEETLRNEISGHIHVSAGRNRGDTMYKDLDMGKYLVC